MTIVRFQVLGTPAPQGSKTRTQWGMREDNPKTRPWRQEVAHIARAAMNGGRPLTGPLNLSVDFVMPRPKSHYRTGRHAGELKPGAPVFCDKRPDTDKLLRAICDACTAGGVWLEDSQVATIHARKVYATDYHSPGARVVVEMLDAILEEVAA